MKNFILKILHAAMMDVVGTRFNSVNRVPSERSKRSPELITEMRDKAESKRGRKAEKLSRDYRKSIRNNPCIAAST